MFPRNACIARCAVPIFLLRALIWSNMFFFSGCIPDICNLDNISYSFLPFWIFVWIFLHLSSSLWSFSRILFGIFLLYHLWFQASFGVLRGLKWSGLRLPSITGLGCRFLGSVSLFLCLFHPWVVHTVQLPGLLLCPLLLTWFFFKPQHGLITTSLIMCGTKSLIHS